MGTHKALLQSVSYISHSCPHLLRWHPPSLRYFERLGEAASGTSPSGTAAAGICCHLLWLSWPLSSIHRTAWETQNSLRQPSVVPHENTSVCVKVSSPGPRLNAKVGRVVPSLTLYLIHLQGSKAGPQVLNVIHIPSWKQFLQCLPQIFLQRFKNNPGGWICKYTKSNTLALGPPSWANKYLEESPAHKFFKEPDSRFQSQLD